MLMTYGLITIFVAICFHHLKCRCRGTHKKFTSLEHQLELADFLSISYDMIIRSIPKAYLIEKRWNLTDRFSKIYTQTWAMESND